MNAKAPDTSRISFTALYTGHVWQEHGLADPVLRTARGPLLYKALKPLNGLADLLRPGMTLETMLLQRHKLIDHLLEQAIETAGLTQIVEVAAGLSPRGIRFRKKYAERDLRYVEADLPAMIARKSTLLQNGGYLNDNHRAVECNALATSGPGSLVRIFYEHLDLSKPAAIITEGLVNYFSPDDLETMWSGFAAALGQCPKGFYFSDIVLNLNQQDRHGIIDIFKFGLDLATRGKTYFHFASPEACINALENAGFKAATVHNPQDYIQKLGLPGNRNANLVYVLAAELAKA